LFAHIDDRARDPAKWETVVFHHVRRARTALALALLAVVAAAPARADRVDDLGRTLVSDPSWRVRLQAVVVLGKIGDRRAVPSLIQAISDSNETVRGLAAQVLGDLGGEDAQPALARAASADSSGFVREKALASLRKLRPESSSPGGGGGSGTLHIEIGGIGSKAPNTPPELMRNLRELLTQELGHTPGVSLEGGGRTGFVVDTSITSLTKHVSGPVVEISCEVAFTVGKLPSKAIVMMTSGGATVQASKASFRPAYEVSLQKDALAGAVKGAHENLVSFLRTQQASAPSSTVGRSARR
jgi:hypothetical protein